MILEIRGVNGQKLRFVLKKMREKKIIKIKMGFRFAI